MKKILAGIIALSAIAVAPVFAQKGEKDKKILEERVVVGKPLNGKKTEEIVIRKNGDKDVNVTIEIKGDKVMINGKPLAEFKDDDITVNKRKVRILGNNNYSFNFDNNFDEEILQGMDGNNFNVWSDDNGKEEKTTFLGVTTVDADGGAKIEEVSKGSGAEKAGLKEGDIITKVGGTKIDGPAALSEAIKAKKPKEEVIITYTRDGKESTAKATLGEKVQRNVRVFSMNGNGQNGLTFGDNLYEMPSTGGHSFSIPRVRVPRVNIDRNFNGNISDMNDNIDEQIRTVLGRPKLGLKIQDLEEGDGVKVTEVEKETAAEKSGLKKDDIITEISGKKIKNTDDAREELRPAPDKTSYSIKAKRNGAEMNFEVKVPKKIKTVSF